MRFRDGGATRSVGLPLPTISAFTRVFDARRGEGGGEGVTGGSSRILLGALAAVTLTSCNIDSGAGYVEIKAIPPSASIPLYLDQVKLDPLRNGNAVLRQKVGTVKLTTDIDGAGHVAFLCNIEVKKNRITSVTVSFMSRQPRCQCGRTNASESGPNRTCIG
jgi:hypothetical protein